VSGGLPKIPRSSEDDFSQESVARRLDLCERAAGVALPHLAGRSVAPAEARGKVENLVGFAQVPLGIAGPLRVDTHRGEREVFVPMATTEGAMVASYARGMKLLCAAGTCRARVVAEGLSQHPMLVYADAAAAARAREAVPGLCAELERLTASSTAHGKLSRVEPELVGRRLVLRLVFTTGDAIGINMAARAAELCSELVARKTGAERRYVHGEDVEKRANARALHEGRGRSVVCDALVPRPLLAEHLRVTPEDLAAVHQSYQVGFARLGTHNGLVQSANGLAAVFLACGQDVAYVTESATGFLELVPTEAGGLYACAHLPSLLVGTVGGGSGQGTAAECLDLLGVRGPGGANLFAELLAATVLAGDLSLLAAFCTHEFVAAHERLGRNRPGGAR
jgi:hydroxymethylglutaryl-CoA reductase (NADPH)